MEAGAAGEPTLRTISHVMWRLSCSRSTVYVLARDGKLDMVKLGGSTRVTERSLKELEAKRLELRKVESP
jgi:excisionase family DNA binding protein